MPDDRVMELFFELFSGLPRQGPGNAESTWRALRALPTPGEEARILDIGCGTGAQTLDLARASEATITAVDIHEPFVDELNAEAARQGLSERVVAQVGDMTALDFPDGSFDLLWSEGAVYFMGVEAALKAWRPLLRPGGHVAVSQLCWLVAEPPEECRAYFREEYPEMRHADELRQAIGASGYELIEDFPLPPEAWWADYYEPLERNLVAFRDRHVADAEAVAIAERTEREVEMFRRHGDAYGYLFLVAREA